MAVADVDQDCVKASELHSLQVALTINADTVVLPYASMRQRAKYPTDVPSDMATAAPTCGRKQERQQHRVVV